MCDMGKNDKQISLLCALIDAVEAERKKGLVIKEDVSKMTDSVLQAHLTRNFIFDSLQQILRQTIIEFKKGRLKEEHHVSEREKANIKANDCLDLILKYGDINGAHHKQWLLDQLVKTLTRGHIYEDMYEEWVRIFEHGIDGAGTYKWDKGIAP